MANAKDLNYGQPVPQWERQKQDHTIILSGQKVTDPMGRVGYVKAVRGERTAFRLGEGFAIVWSDTPKLKLKRVYTIEGLAQDGIIWQDGELIAGDPYKSRRQLMDEVWGLRLHVQGLKIKIAALRRKIRQLEDLVEENQ